MQRTTRATIKAREKRQPNKRKPCMLDGCVHDGNMVRVSKLRKNVNAWLAVCVDEEFRAAMRSLVSEGKDCYIARHHFRLPDLYGQGAIGSGKRKICVLDDAVPKLELSTVPMTIDADHLPDKEKYPPKKRAKWRETSTVDQCPCTEGDSCKLSLQIAGLAVHPPPNVTKGFYKDIISSGTDYSKRCQDAVSLKASVHIDHFHPDWIKKKTGPFGKEIRTALKPPLKKSKIINLLNQEKQVITRRKDQLLRKGTVRSNLLHAGLHAYAYNSSLMHAVMDCIQGMDDGDDDDDDDGDNDNVPPTPSNASSSMYSPPTLSPTLSMSPRSNSPLSKSTVVSPQNTTSPPNNPVRSLLQPTFASSHVTLIQRPQQTPRSSPSQHAHSPTTAMRLNSPGGLTTKTVSFDIMDAIKTNEESCRYYTSIDGWAELVLLWQYLDADKAFSTLTIDPRGPTASEIAPYRIQRRSLTPFEQFLFALVSFTRFRGRGQLFHCAQLFGLHPRTGHRYYEAWVLALGRFFEGQQHPATRAQSAAVVPKRSKGNLGLSGNTAGFIGDCTERWVDDPSDGALHSALYSQYKSHTTLKYLVITTLDSYQSLIPRPVCGGCTDNGCHIVSGIYDIL